MRANGGNAGKCCEEGRVDRSLVSIVLNNKPASIKVAEATREKIFRTAREMNYSPNLLARGLRKGKTQTIGFLAGSPRHEILSAQTMVLDKFVDKAGYRLYVSYTMGELDRMVKTANELVARGGRLILRGRFPGTLRRAVASRSAFPFRRCLLNRLYRSHAGMVYQDVGLSA